MLVSSHRLISSIYKQVSGCYCNCEKDSTVTSLAISENVSIKSSPSCWVYPFATSLALYLSMEPSAMYLILYTHLHPMGAGWVVGKYNVHWMILRVVEGVTGWFWALSVGQGSDQRYWVEMSMSKDLRT
ncbi:uncharacterized protein E5676_scaffold2679G00030 [Cucumis melo var. makuwa]|uniref:Uncharacterized protein n=1 Tax=Cucumis melo var. makuwa TaxID=1194695 RepID=A0A5D3BW90_CUCMM|nr:uncharacterized protein E6C27_scaffold88G001280 [Cucumis melo var. makuwa]TYK03394.1 uncharacterized protein E5676_scaffold2679G00030 [Cucumis melo var. makuwa]